MNWKELKRRVAEAKVEEKDEESRMAAQEAHYDYRYEILGEDDNKRKEEIFRDAAEREAFETALLAWQPQEELNSVLQQLHPGLTLSDLAMKVMVDFARNTLALVLDACFSLITKQLAEVHPHGKARLEGIGFLLLALNIQNCTHTFCTQQFVLHFLASWVSMHKQREKKQYSHSQMCYY